MNPVEMKEVVRRVMEDGFNKADFSVVDASFHPHYVRHGHAGQPSANSLAEHKAALATLHRQFSGARFVIQQMLADGDWVAVRFELQGTHAGEVLGIAASGREIRRPTAAFFRFDGDKIAEGHILSDVYGMMQQIGGARG
ncbi:MAG: ester cyclase [Burkholderiaceae bacterium]